MKEHQKWQLGTPKPWIKPKEKPNYLFRQLMALLCHDHWHDRLIHSKRV